MDGKKLRFWIALCLTVGISLAADAQGPSPPSVSQEDLKARVERLERQNQELMDALKKLQSSQAAVAEQPTSTSATGQPSLDKNDVQKIVGDYLQSVEAKKQAEKAAAKQKEEEEGYKVGTDLGMSVRWKDGVLFETPHKDFWAHIGGWFQYDNVWFNQSKRLLAAPPAGVGDFQDGDFFRRTRLQLDGGFWQVYEYNMIFGFESTQKSTVSLFEFWGGIKDVPYLGMIRVGRMVTPNGLEGDDTTTNKSMTFFERSSMSDAFYQNFASGIWQGNSILDQRFCYQSMLYYTDPGLTATSVGPVGGLNTGDFFGDGEFAAGVRLTGLPIWENDGRDFVHLGAFGPVRSSATLLRTSTAPSTTESSTPATAIAWSTPAL
jgi:phosphate-selective porin